MRLKPKGKPTTPVGVVSEQIREARADISRTMANCRASLMVIRYLNKDIRKTYRAVVKFIGVKNIDYTWMSTRMMSGVYFHVTMKSTDSLQSVQIVSALAQLLDDGWETTKSDDHADYLKRTHYLTKGVFNLTLETYANSDSTTCRKVLIGEETKVVPKYKIECDSIFK